LTHDPAHLLIDWPLGGRGKDQRNRAFYFASMRTKLLNDATIPFKPILYTHVTHV